MFINMEQLPLFTFLFLLATVFLSTDSKFVIDKVELCSPSANYPMKFDIVFKTDSEGYQRVDVNITIPAPVGDKIGVKIGFFYVPKGRAVRVAAVKEDNTCKALNKYFGEFWFDVARAAGCPPKTCPIPKGIYYLKNYKLNFDALPVQSIPFGIIRVDIEVSDFRNKSVWWCGKIFVNHI